MTPTPKHSLLPQLGMLVVMRVEGQDKQILGRVDNVGVVDGATWVTLKLPKEDQDPPPSIYARPDLSKVEYPPKLEHSLSGCRVNMRYVTHWCEAHRWPSAKEFMGEPQTGDV